MAVEIRTELPADRRAVGTLLAAAFGADHVNHMVDLIRDSPGYVPEYALVADDDGVVVGHVMLSRIPLRSSGTQVLTLTPLAVHPDRQGAGIGRALVEAALHRADRAAEGLVVLEGSPNL